MIVLSSWSHGSDLPHQQVSPVALDAVIECCVTARSSFQGTTRCAMHVRYILGGYASEKELNEQIMCSTFSPATFCGAYLNLKKLVHPILIFPRTQKQMLIIPPVLLPHATSTWASGHKGYHFKAKLWRLGKRYSKQGGKGGGNVGFLCSIFLRNMEALSTTFNCLTPHKR